MNVEFGDKDAEKLYTEAAGPYLFSLSPVVVAQFFRVIQMIEAAEDTRDLRMHKGRHFEEMKHGVHKGRYSMRLDLQFRILFTVNGDTAVIHSIEDYH